MPISQKQETDIDKAAIGSLSRREEQVLSLAAAGFLDKQIGAELGVSLNTLRTYWTRIRSKVGEGSRSALAVAYVEKLADEAPTEGGEPDWELDLHTNSWKKLSDREIAFDAQKGAEFTMEQVISTFHEDYQSGLLELLRQVKETDISTFTFSGVIHHPTGLRPTAAFAQVIREEGVAVKILGTYAPSMSIDVSGPSRLEPVRHDGWIYYPATGQVLASDAINELHGLECGQAYTRATYESLFDSEDYAHALAVMDEIVKGKFETSNFLLRTIESNRTEEVLITVHGTRDSHGKVDKVIGYRTRLQPATAREKPKPQVRVGFWAKNFRSGSFIVPDDEFCKIYKVDRESPTLDDDIKSRYQPKDVAAAYNFIDEALASKEIRGSRSFELRFEDGTKRHITLEFFIEHDDEGPYRASGTVLAFD